MLSLSDNQLTELPAELGQLRFLSELYLLRNRLASLPREIGQLEQLQELYLWGNLLTTLPPEIGMLDKLTVLNLVRNNLSELPPEIRNLSGLKELYLHGNPQLRLPTEVLGPTSTHTHYRQRDPASPSDILAFYFSSRLQPVLEARIIIIGDGGVGKTSLARQLVHSQVARKDEKQTSAVIIEPWTVTLRGSKVQINVWDFGGQEPMHAAHPYFFTERTLYLVVVSARDTGVDERIEYWLKMVGKYGNEAVAIIVVNRVDEHVMDVARRDLCSKYTFLSSDPNQAFRATSCISGEGIAELRHLIFRQLESMEQIWDRIPAEYFDVKSSILRMRIESEEIITFERWKAICDESKVCTPSDRDRLLDLLRNLGLVVSFPRERKLRHLGVLNPDWVVSAIYPLLTSAELVEAGGLLSLSDIEKSLPSDRYPKESHGWLIELMEAFELLFADESDRYLVPARLLTNGTRQPLLRTVMAMRLITRGWNKKGDRHENIERISDRRRNARHDRRRRGNKRCGARGLC